mgnify:CR=1 FL=1
MRYVNPGMPTVMCTFFTRAEPVVRNSRSLGGRFMPGKIPIVHEWFC